MLYPINQVFETVYNTLNRQITFQDNFLSFQKNIQFKTLSTYTSDDWDPFSFGIPDNFQVKVSGVIILSLSPVDTTLAAGSPATSLIWAENNRYVDINWIAGLADETSYNLSVLII